MFATWVTNGVGIGVTIFFAVFTLLVLAGVVVGFLALGAKVFEDDEKKNRMRY